MAAPQKTITPDKIVMTNKQLKSQVDYLKKKMEDIEEKCKTLEFENQRLKVERENEVILKVIDMHNNLQRLNTEIIKLTTALTKEITENRYDYEEELQKYAIQYKKREGNLENYGVMVDHFKNLRRENTRKQKEILEKIGNPFNEEDKLDIMQSYISINSTDFKSYIDGREKILNELKQVSFLNDFKIEKEMLKDLITTCKDDICPPSTSNMSHSSDDADENAVVMKKFPESDTVEDDLRNIKSFLSINFNVEEVKDMIRLGHSRIEGRTRFVKVILKNQETVRHVLEKNNEKHTRIIITEYEKDYNKKKLKRANLI